MSSVVSWTPAVRACLNTNVINRFGAGFAQGITRISGLLDICGPRPTDSENLVVLVLGKNFQLYRRNRTVKDVRKRRPNIYEQRAKLGNFADFLVIDRMDAIYDKIEAILAIASTAGAEAAEGPTRMIEVAVPQSLGFECHTGQNYFSEAHPVKPGSSATWKNLYDLGALDFDTFDAAEKALIEIPDEDGRAANNQVTTLAYGPAYKQIATEIINNSMPKDYAGGQNMRAKQGIKGILVPDWGDEFWMVCDDSRADDMPFYFSEGRPLTVRPLFTNPEGEYETLTNELVWGVDGDMAVALGNPRRAVLAADPSAAATIIAKYKAKYELNPIGPDAFDLEPDA